MSKAAWFGLLIVLAVLVYQALLPAYWQHLLVDPNAYFTRLSYFVDHGTLKGIPFIEYQPGAFLYFLLLLPSVKVGIGWLGFVMLFLYLNLFMAVIIGYWISKNYGARSLHLYSLILLAGGPIILFRFELIVVFLTMLALNLLQKKQSSIGAFILGIATSVKIYPLILLPLIKNKIWAGLTGLGIVVAIYVLITRPTIGELAANTFIHSKKPVNLESIQATLFNLGAYGFHRTFLPVESRIVYGLPADSLPFPEFIAHGLGFMAVAIWFILKKPGDIFLQAAATIAIFLIFNSQLAPQYLYWFALLIPLIKKPKLSYILTTLFTLALTQVIYPVWYLDLISSFMSSAWTPSVTLLYFRNISLLLTSALLIHADLRD